MSGTNNDILTLILCNQQKLMAQNQVFMLQQCRLISHLADQPLAKMLEQSEELYRQELNKVRLANLAELRNLQGKPRTNESGGGLEGAG
jgi:hypothetical protein